MNLQEFNNKDRSEVREALFQCCGSTKWTDTLMTFFPFESVATLVKHATDIWYNECDESDWRESFTHHPKIGDIENLEKKFASTEHLAGQEQSGVNSASKETIQALAKTNSDYEDKNGFIFIVCATGRSAEEMLKIAHNRLSNFTEEEVHVAMGEQAKITIIRFKKLLSESNWSDFEGSQLTSHVLDTSTGVPGRDLLIKLQQSINGGWQTVSQGVTNVDGRVADLLAPGRELEHKNYKMIFDTGSYFKQNNMRGFYPEVEVQFTVLDNKHYHVPLLINPFGYSTYRGS